MPYPTSWRAGRRLRRFTLLGIALAACSEVPVGPTPLPPQLPPIDAGVVTGQPVLATIGPTGGSIALADGSASVSIPAGALPRATELSLQALSNTAPNGVGTGVRFGPTNVAFASPVTITLRFDSSATDSSSADGLVVARQDSTGAWMGYVGSTVNPSPQVASNPSVSLRISNAARAGGAVAARTRRTGDYVPGRLWLFTPLEAAVATNATVPLKVLACHDELRETEPLPGEPDGLAFMQQVCVPSIRTPTWSVNDVVGGTNVVGRIAAGVPTTATYTAPAAVPTPNTVTAKLALYWAARNVTKTFTSRITINPEVITLLVVGEYRNPQERISIAGGVEPAAVIDSVVFNVNVVTRPYYQLTKLELVRNTPTIIESGGAFTPSPFFCKPSEVLGAFDHILVTGLAPGEDLAPLPTSRLSLPLVGTYTLRGANNFLLNDLGDCARVFTTAPFTSGAQATAVLPAKDNLPARVGDVVDVNDRTNGSGWTWRVIRLNPAP